MEDRTPFLQTVITDLVVAGAVALLLREHFPLVAVAAVAMIPLSFLGVPAMAVLGSLLVSLAFAYAESGATAERNRAIAVILAVIVLELIFVLAGGRERGSRARSMVRLNILFAFIGMAGCRVAQFVTCPPTTRITLDTLMTSPAQAIFEVANCHAQAALADFMAAAQGSATIPWDAFALSMLRIIAFMPALWTVFLAALAEVLATRQLRRLGRTALHSVWRVWIAETGLFFILIVLVLGIGVLATLVPEIVPLAESLRKPELWLTALTVLLAIDTCVVVVAAGKGAASA